jgi:hypothetical protein
MRYCYSMDWDASDEDDVLKAKNTTAMCPITPSLPTTTQTQPHGSTHPTHSPNRPAHNTDLTEHSYNSEHENNRTEGDKQTDGNGHEREGLIYGTETRHPSAGGLNAGTMNGTHEHASQPTPTNTPIPPPPQLPTPARITLPVSNQQGHVTTLKSDQHDKCKLAPASGGTLKTNIKYPRRTWCHPPLSWLAIDNKTAVPDHIEGSRPLFPQPKH